MAKGRARLVVLLLFGLLAICAGGATVIGAYHAATGRPGTITVAGCARDNGAHKPTYDCTGTFTALDGGYTRTNVSFTESTSEPAGARISATLNGDTVHETDWAGTVTGALVSLGSLVVVALILVRGRKRPS